MIKLLLLTVMIVIFIGTGACSKDGTSNSDKPSVERSTDNSRTTKIAGSGIADALKDKTLPGHESITIGNAFDGYGHFRKKEWKETSPQNGKIYIDFIGWLDTKTVDAVSIKEGVSATAIDVKFAINPDGSFFVAMVSKIDAKTDGKFYSYPIEDSAGILARIYANKEMVF